MAKVVLDKGVCENRVAKVGREWGSAQKPLYFFSKIATYATENKKLTGVAIRKNNIDGNT